MGKLIKIRKNQKGIVLERLTEGGIIIFSDGRKEKIKEVDNHIGALYTQRERIEKGYLITEEIAYNSNLHGVINFNDPGKVYDWKKRRIS